MPTGATTCTGCAVAADKHGCGLMRIVAATAPARSCRLRSATSECLQANRRSLACGATPGGLVSKAVTPPKGGRAFPDQPRGGGLLNREPPGHAAALSSLSTPRASIFRASSGKRTGGSTSAKQKDRPKAVSACVISNLIRRQVLKSSDGDRL
jgi:hypothetical protein